MKRSIIALILAVLMVPAFGTAAEEQAVSLGDMEPFETCGIREDAVLLDGQDRYGGSYTSCFGPNDDIGYVEYLLNGEYDRLETVLYVTGADLNPYYDYYWAYATCRIYGDDQLLFSKTGFQHKDEPLPLTMDVHGVRFLRIEFELAAYYNTGAGRPLILLGDSTLIRTTA